MQGTALTQSAASLLTLMSSLNSTAALLEIGSASSLSAWSGLRNDEGFGHLKTAAFNVHRAFRADASFRVSYQLRLLFIQQFALKIEWQERGTHAQALDSFRGALGAVLRAAHERAGEAVASLETTTTSLWEPRPDPGQTPRAHNNNNDMLSSRPQPQPTMIQLSAASRSRYDAVRLYVHTLFLFLYLVHFSR